MRKTYGQDGIRYPRCQCCGAEFSERKESALWNTKVSEARAVAVAEHLSEGCSLKATARLVQVDPSVVRRLNRKVAEHGEALHDERVHNLTVDALEADERHGYAHDKSQPQWEAELMDPVSKFIISHVQGKREETLIRRLLEDGASRLADRQRLVLLTDGEASYASLFPELFGQPYRPSRHGNTGRFPAIRYCIPRSLAHVQIIKHRQGSRVVDIEIRYAHGTRTRVHQVLYQLGYAKPNTSAIERRNATARRMSAHQVRRSLAFSRRPDTKLALGWWAMTVYHWCRPHSSLRWPLLEPQGKKSLSPKHPRWRWGLPISFGPSVSYSSLPSTHQEGGDNLISLPINHSRRTLMKIHKRFIFLAALLAVVAISLVVARPASALGSYGGSTVTYDCALGLVDYSITATTNPPDGYWVQALQGATWIDDDFYSNVSNPSGTLNISTAAPGVPIVIQIWDDAPPVGVGIVVLATVTCGAGGHAGHAAPTVEPAASVWLANVCEPHDGFSDAGWMTLDTDKRGRTLYIAAASTGPWMESGQGGAPWVLNRAAIDALASAVGLSDYHDLWLRVGTDGQFAKLGSMIADREAREAQLCGVGS